MKGQKKVFVGPDPGAGENVLRWGVQERHTRADPGPWTLAH